MTTSGTIRVPTWRDWGIALVIFLGAVIAASAAARGDPPAREGALGAAGLTAAATCAMTWWVMRFATYPTWAYWTSAAVLGVSAVAAAALLPDLRVWEEALRSSLWMHPWYPLAMTTFTVPGARACGAGTTWGGWLMVGTALLLSICGPALAWLF